MSTEMTMCFWQNFPQTIFYTLTAIMSARLKYKINKKRKSSTRHIISRSFVFLS